MSDFAYTRLSEMDRSFLIAEGRSSPMHVGAVEVLDGGPLLDASGAIDFERILEYVASRLHRIPRYRQHVVPAPIDGHPIWVDDPRFNLRYHVRHTRLPRPGGERLLKRACARILEQPLDLHKPLWELWVVEGLEGGRVALVNKIHHCMVDGVAGADLMSVLMTPEPCETIEPAPVWLPRRGPTAAEYAATEFASRITAPLEIARSIGKLVTDEGHARAEFAERVEAAARIVGSALAGTSASPFNQPIGPHRRIDWLQVSFEDIALIRSRFGGTLNDVVLAVVAGAVRRFLKKSRLTDPDGIDFRVMAPVSMRGARDGQLGNRVAAWFLSLPIGERDPVERLARVQEATARLKRRHDALGFAALTQAVEWIGSAPIVLGTRVLERSQPPFHMVVTNVPGPRGPLHLLGARMLEAHPMVPLIGQLALGVALFSYDGKLSWGITADWDLVPDLHDFVLAVQHSFDGLLARARAAPERTEAEPAPGRAKRAHRRSAAAARHA